MLTDRQLIILQTIIDNFIQTATPVGSRVLSKNEKISLSAATIRNVMADLEDLGLLEKTHSSSGRIPSEKGYRYYVDHVIGPSIKNKEVDLLTHMIEDNIYEYEQIVQTSADLLSKLTNYTTIILGPDVIKARLKQIQFITISPQLAVAILVTNTGHVEHRSVTIPSGLNVNDLEKLVNILNEKLYNVPIIHLEKMLETEIYNLMKKHINQYDQMYTYLKSVMRYEQPVKVFIGGQTNLLTQPEFRDIEKVYSLYTMMENEEKIAKLLESPSSGIKVTIGNENENDAINHLSLITSSYNLGLNQMGTIGLLGPTRMEYKKVITLLKSLSNELSQLLRQAEDKE
ncbi:MAG TPA: heat-inducible transcriptional repressor HrcA [Pseudogracilibacillus sp.]|nr:heat-inducible transcriptional repressor HrcA [Pseudogracilibacillus sp.]